MGLRCALQCFVFMFWGLVLQSLEALALGLRGFRAKLIHGLQPPWLQRKLESRGFQFYSFYRLIPVAEFLGSRHKYFPVEADKIILDFPISMFYCRVVVVIENGLKFLLQGGLRSGCSPY